jgi:hypothetical protein
VIGVGVDVVGAVGSGTIDVSTGTVEGARDFVDAVAKELCVGVGIGVTEGDGAIFCLLQPVDIKIQTRSIRIKSILVKYLIILPLRGRISASNFHIRF